MVQTKQTKALTLENGETTDVLTSVADKWLIKAPKNYLFNYGGKIALIQLKPINEALISANIEPIYSFSDAIERLVSLTNKVADSNVEFMSHLVNADKTSLVAKADKTATKFTDEQLNKAITEAYKKNATDMQILLKLQEWNVDEEQQKRVLPSAFKVVKKDEAIDFGF